MLFHEKLDFLMTLTDITNSKLSKDANIDPSLISRWRRGIKFPALHSDAVRCIAKALAQRVNDDFRKSKFSEAAKIKTEDLTDRNIIVNTILEWFADSPSPTNLNPIKPLRLKPYPSYKNRQISPLDSLSIAESYCVGKEGRIKALQWIMSFVKHWPSGGTLRFYTDQPSSWLEVDHEFYREALQKDPRLADKFNIVKILLQKKSVEKAVTLGSRSAQLHMQSQYFFRLILTAGVLLVAGYMHANFDARYINLFGVALGIPTLHVASYAIKFFIKDDTPAEALEGYAPGIASPEDAIRDIQNMAAEGNQEKA